MAVTHLAECGKEKLKNWHVIPANSGHPECLVVATRLQLREKRGRGEADAAIQNASSLRGGEADAGIQDTSSLRGGETDVAIQAL
jgi:hypothetical protein